MPTNDTPASGTQPEYTIHGGQTDADRLGRQAQVMAAASADFLSRTGLAEGWACLDVGCGDGQVTMWLAQRVGPTGRAVGIDVDEEALRIAEQAAQRAGVPADYRRCDAATPLERDSFDLAFARLLLSHLVDPQAALRAMRSSIRPGGVVAVEDLFTEALRSQPPTAALEGLQEVYSATVRAHGGDPTLGPRLPAMLRAAGLVDVREQTAVNLMRTSEEKVFLVELLDNMREAILDAKAASADELDEIRSGVQRAADDPARVFYQARMHQVWGQRPEV